MAMQVQPPEIVAVERIIHSGLAADSSPYVMPTTSMLTFPPFPSPPLTLEPFNTWQQHGIWVRDEVASSLDGDDPQKRAGSSHARDSLGNSLVKLGQGFAGSGEEPMRTRQERRMANDKTATRVSLENCFKIGNPNSGWKEPTGTSRSDYNPTIPPFTRLISAARDFHHSRSEAFQFIRTKRLFDSMRNALGLRAKPPGRHGPSDHVDACAADHHSGMDSVTPALPSQQDEETCVFLTRMEDSVRGFLALARQEASWDFEHAVKLTEIMAAFIAYLAQHQVLSEDDLTRDLCSISMFVGTAPEKQRQSKQLEDSLLWGLGWNRATWTMWGGQYGDAERGGLEKEIAEWPVIEGQGKSLADEIVTDDGGWIVEPIIDHRPEPCTAQEVSTYFASMLGSSALGDIGMLGHIPFSRRRIIAVLPPVGAHEVRPEHRFHRLVTVPAPWTPEEKWRSPRATDDVDEEESFHAQLALERENATIVEPDELIIYCDDSKVAQHADLVGMGLRGRWGLFGDGKHRDWWAFKAKDFVLPSFWQSESARM